jgi:O-antigen/teichoic acid export membrane protein
MGKEIAELSITEIRAPIRRALYPGLARIADRQERLSEVLVESTAMFALLTVPIPLGIALVAEDLVPLFLGAQWQPTVAVLQPLCIAVAVSALGNNSQLAYMALNRAHLAAIAAVVRLLLLAALLVVLPVSYGVIGVAYVVAGVSCIMLVADYALSARILSISTGRFLCAVWRPVTASLAMCVAVWLIRSGFAPAADLPAHVWSLVRSTLLGAVVYVVCLLALWVMGGRRDGAERRLVALATHFFDRLGRNAR